MTAILEGFSYFLPTLASAWQRASSLTVYLPSVVFEYHPVTHGAEMCPDWAPCNWGHEGAEELSWPRKRRVAPWLMSRHTHSTTLLAMAGVESCSVAQDVSHGNVL